MIARPHRRMLLFLTIFLLCAETAAFVWCVTKSLSRDANRPQDLLSRLRSPDPSVRQAAVYECGPEWAGDWGTSLLDKVLRTDPSPEVRASAAWVLGKIASLACSSPRARNAAVDALANAIESDPDVEVRGTCLLALDECPDKRVIPVFAELARKDPVLAETAERLLYTRFPRAKGIELSSFAKWWTRVRERVSWNQSSMTFEMGDNFLIFLQSLSDLKIEVVWKGLELCLTTLLLPSQL